MLLSGVLLTYSALVSSFMVPPPVPAPEAGRALLGASAAGPVGRSP